MSRRAKIPTKTEQKFVQAEMKRVGAALKKRRLELGITQERLAEAIGATTEAVRFIENAYRAPSFATLVRIAAQLELRIEVLK